jgi:alpha-methylacyl-CoA racemase
MSNDHSSSRMGPLHDVRVLDLSRHWPGGRCTVMLADLGADVIKVEAPGGDAVRSEPRTAWVNSAIHRGKRSIVLNLKKPGAADVLRRLVETADVVLESARPGAMERMGVGYEQLSEINPRLVWCSLTGFGDGSPLADEAAHELNFLAYTGMLRTMYPEPKQSYAPFAIATSMGGLMAAFGIVAALRERDRSGVGSRVDASVNDSAAWLLSDLLVGQFHGFKTLVAGQAAVSTYVCADGRLVAVSATEPITWIPLVEGLGLPHLRDRVPLSDENNDEIVADFVRVFATRPSTEWLELFDGRAAVGPVNELADLFDDPHMVAREAIVERGGERVFANPIRISGPDGPMTYTAPGGPPPVGGDTDDVLLGAGYTAAEIDELREAGATL